MLLNRLKFLVVSHHFAKFCGHRPCDSSDIAAKIVNVTLQDYVMKGSDNFMEGNSSLHIPTLPKLTAIDTVLMIYNCFSLSRDLARLRSYMVI